MLVDVQRVPLLEATTLQAVEDASELIIEGTLPGFIVRAAHSEIGISHKIGELLAKASGQTFERRAYVSDAAHQVDRTYTGVGRIHDDASPELIGPYGMFNIHHSVKGIGRVMLAQAGPDYRAGNIIDRAVITKHLSQNKTNPLLMLPELRTAMLCPGDRVVFPLLTHEGPVLHRFDTIEEPRVATATFLY